MKKLLFIFLSALVLVSCTESNLKSTPTSVIYARNGTGLTIEEYTIDGCQYIGYLHGSNCDWCTHKGNCNNPIHKLQKDTLQ